MGSFDIPPMGSYLLPIDTYGLSLTVFELFSWLQKRVRPPVRPGYDDKHTLEAIYRFVERQ